MLGHAEARKAALMTNHQRLYVQTIEAGSLGGGEGWARIVGKKFMSLGLLISLLKRCDLMLEDQLLILRFQLLDLALERIVLVNLGIEHQSYFVYLGQDDNGLAKFFLKSIYH